MKALKILTNLCFLLALICIGCPPDKENDPTYDLAVLDIECPADITTSSFTTEVSISSNGGGTISEAGICFSSSPYPTIDDQTEINGSSSELFSVSVTGLPAGALYYVRGFATNEKGTAYSIMEYCVMTSFDTVTDQEGNVYGTVKIGSQEWMRDNLRSTKYADGTDIPRVSPAGGSESNAETFGRLYDWYAVMHGEASSELNPSMVQGVCPSGFHVPSDAEWIELEMYLGMTEYDANSEGYRGDIAGKLKVKQFWSPSPNISDNSTGFSAVPAGSRELDGSIHYNDYFWCGFYIATQNAIDTSEVSARLMTGDMNGIWRYPDSKKYGFSMRCIKDE